jgi:hypothetical protein
MKGDRHLLTGNVHVASRLVTGRRRLQVLCGAVCMLAAVREGKCLHYSLNEQVHIHRLPYQDIISEYHVRISLMSTYTILRQTNL